MNAVTHLEKVITGEVSAVTHLEKVIASETSAVTYTEKVITGEAPPITHLQKVIAGEASPVTHLEHIWAGGSPTPTEHEYTGAVPVTFTADGTPLLDFLISGNMSQTGTPTSTTPIQPSECGERTGNLFDGTLLGGYFTNADFNRDGNESVYKSIKVYLTAGAYTFSWGKNVNSVRLIVDGNYSQPAYANISTQTIISTTDGYVGISFRDTTSSSTVWDNTTPIMLNTGSTALPYEPYGYKLDISSANTTTPVYLGEIESTRRIYKYAFTGQETEWRITGTGRMTCVLPTTSLKSQAVPCICSHYIGVGTSSIGSINNGECSTNTSGNEYVVYDTNYTTIADFKSYLAQQYAAGTPVTVWYVLAEPTTGIVNEPLRKIGDYADTLSMEQAGVSIPTNNGSTTVDVDTTLKPSEVYIKYKGV